MNKDQLIDLLVKINEKIQLEKDYLIELDRPIGDCDHGTNMARGFKAIEDKIDELKNKDISSILKQCGMILVSQVGGSSGPLYGTAFLNAGKAMSDKESIAIDDFITILKVAIDGVKMRGKAELNEATMLDAMIPAYESIKDLANCNAKDVLETCYKAAYNGAESTINMIATKGRASYLGERGIGHKDPGAASFTFIIETIKDFVRTYD